MLSSDGPVLAVAFEINDLAKRVGRVAYVDSTKEGHGESFGRSILSEVCCEW